METRLREIVKTGEDHILLIDIGLTDREKVVVVSIGKAFSGIERKAIVV